MQDPNRDPNRSSGLHRGFRFNFKKRRVRFVALLPTTITLCNGICGMLAILQIHAGNIGYGAYLILAGMIFDALDGKVARVTRTASTFGAQLDSFCDLLTFGIAPGFLVYATAMQKGSWLPNRIIVVVAVLYAMCALVRLARFTVETSPDEKSHLEFTGLPSPAAAGVIASSLVPWHAFEMGSPVLHGIAKAMEVALPVVAFLLGVLMVSRVRYVHLVNRIFRGYRPFVTLVELSLAAILIVIFYEFALFIAFIVYAAIGPVAWVVRVLRKPAPAPASQLPPPQDPLF